MRYHSAWIERNECESDPPVPSPPTNNQHKEETSRAEDDDSCDYSSDDEISPDEAWSDSEDMEQFNPFKIDDDLLWTSTNEDSASANPSLKESQHLLHHPKKPAIPVTPQHFNAPKQLKPKSTTTRTNRTTQRKKRSENVATLFIVMQLYSTTLAQWLDHRPPDMVDPRQNIHIFHQISILILSFFSFHFYFLPCFCFLVHILCLFHHVYSMYAHPYFYFSIVY